MFINKRLKCIFKKEIMVSAVSRPYIDASVPVLREHGLTITRTFYKNMFAEHPELTRIFNMGNQASGVQQQSLAAAVFAYAANIDNAQALGPVISRIAHKHASVGIQAKHYPIVGRHLLGAIKEVLGDAATPELIAAWAEAYGELADALIRAEGDLYDNAGTMPGQLQALRVVAVNNESENIKSFVLETLPGEQLPAFKPGQYVSVSATFPGGKTQLRQYSLSDAPQPDRLRISVKRETEEVGKPAGQVSNWLHDKVAPGMLLHITHPFGDFAPDTESAEPIVLLSAGVGITPMIAVLNRILQVRPERIVSFAHAAKAGNFHAHKADLEHARSVMPNLMVTLFYEQCNEQEAQAGVIKGHMDIGRLPQWPAGDTHVYVCGPVKFMQEQWRALLEKGVPASHLHREVFGPELLNHLA